MAAGSDDVWLRKRLIEETEAEALPRDAHLDNVRATITVSSGPTEQSWFYCLRDIPWQRQVGPSCGLAALRMVRDAFLRENRMHEIKSASLLSAALKRGITKDGEIFNIDDLASLAKDVCGLQGNVLRMEEATMHDLLALVFNGRLIVLPYDSDRGSKLPSLEGGHCAHYGVIVGACWPGVSVVGSGADDGHAVKLVECQALAAAELSSATEDRCMLLVQHSMSKRLAVAPLSQFRASNGQLATADDTKFQIDGINLTGQIIVFKSIAKMEM